MKLLDILNELLATEEERHNEQHAGFTLYLDSPWFEQMQMEMREQMQAYPTDVKMTFITHYSIRGVMINVKTKMRDETNYPSEQFMNVLKEIVLQSKYPPLSDGKTKTQD